MQIAIELLEVKPEEAVLDVEEEEEVSGSERERACVFVCVIENEIVRKRKRESVC